LVIMAGDLGEASMNGDRAGRFGGGKEDSPSFVTEAANKECFRFFGIMLEKGGAEAEVLLKRIPITNLGAE
jgi:hypothetical protein